MSTVINFAQVIASAKVNGKKGVLKLDFERLSGKHSKSQKGKDFPVACTWVPWIFIDEHGVQHKFWILVSSEVFLPSGASIQKDTKYGIKAVKVQFKEIEPEEVDVYQVFVKPDSSASVKPEDFKDANAAVYKNTMELIEAMDILHTSAEACFEQLLKMSPKDAGFKVSNSQQRKLIKLESFYDQATGEDKVFDPPLYRTYLEADKKSGVVGVVYPGKSRDVKPCIYSLKKGRAIPAKLKNEDGVLGQPTYLNVNKVVNKGSIASMKFRLAALCCHQSGIKIELLVSEIIVKTNLHNLEATAAVRKVESSIFDKFASLESEEDEEEDEEETKTDDADDLENELSNFGI
jgi:hypothetical protein